jgi:membrane protease subunit (stomatin/prohibitin family)
MVSNKNSMGIELNETDESYARFLEGFSTSEQGEERREASGAEMPEAQTQERRLDKDLIVRCANCNIKNQVNKSKVALIPKCGKCGQPLVLQV